MRTYINSLDQRFNLRELAWCYNTTAEKYEPSTQIVGDVLTNNNFSDVFKTKDEALQDYMGSGEKIDKTLVDTLNTIKKRRPEGRGYIMMPTDGGFDLFEVGEKRLKHYLDMETVLRSNVDNPSQQPSPVGFITDDDVDNMGNTKEGKFAIVGAGSIGRSVASHYGGLHARFMIIDDGFAKDDVDNAAKIATVSNNFGLTPPPAELFEVMELRNYKASQTEYIPEERLNHKRLSAGHGNKKRKSNKKKRK